MLRRLTEHPERPYVMVLGGAKPSDKLGMIANVLGQVDRLVIGGGMSYTFLAAQGYEVGKSLLEADQIPQVSAVLEDAAQRGVEVVLPVDLVAATHYAPDAEHYVARVGEFPADRESLDMGPATRELFAAKLADAKTVFWNGPVGVFEFPAFAAGTRAVAEAVSKVQRADRGRRRRLRGGRPDPRLSRGLVLAHLDRRRGQPRVPRGQAAARAGGARGRLTAERRSRRVSRGGGTGSR